VLPRQIVGHVGFGESHFAPSKPAQVGKEHVGVLAGGAVQSRPLHQREIIPPVPFQTDRH
jgi:hypothetical protein